MIKKFLIIPLLVVLVGLMLGGCPAPTPTPSPTPTPTPTPTPEPTPGPTPEKPLKLILAHWGPLELPPPLDYDPYNFVHQQWFHTIEEETGGRVVFEYYPGESLVKIPDMWDACVAGVCDLSAVHPASIPARFPLTNMLALPGLFSSEISAGLAFQKLYDEGYLPEWEGVHVLFWGTCPLADLGNRERPVHTLEDWKGLKIGVEGEPETSTVKALGAIPVSIPVTDQYIAVERGTIDGCWLAAGGHVVFKWNEVEKYFTNCRGGTRPVVLIMNQERYDSLPTDIKEVFDRNSGMAWAIIQAMHMNALATRCVDYLEQWQADHGLPPIYYPPDEERARWREAWEPVYEEVISEVEAKGLPAREVIDRASELDYKYDYLRLANVTPWPPEER